MESSLLFNFTRVYFTEKPLTLGHEDFDCFCDEDIRGQDASRLHRNWRRGRHSKSQSGKMVVNMKVKYKQSTKLQHVKGKCDFSQTVC